MKILIGIDGSDGSLDAVRQVAAMTAADRDELAFFYAPPDVRFHEKAANQPATIEQARQALAQAVVDKAKEQLPAAMRASVHTIVGTGSPRTGLVEAAAAWSANLLAVGARGAGPMAEVKLGNVARHVARSATMPVLVTRPRRGTGPLAVLYATDGSEASRLAGAALARASWPAGTQGFVMTVLEPYFHSLPNWLAQSTRDPSIDALTEGWMREYEADKRNKHAEMIALAKTLPAPFQLNEPIVAEGHPAEQILKAIDERKIDLVVVGAHGKSAWEQFMIGSTSERLLTSAPCSVLIVRKRDA